MPNVIIVCTNCKKPLKIPAEGLGKKVRCPACKTVFVGKRDEFKPRPAAGDNSSLGTLGFPPPANDALLADEDAPPPALSGSSIIDPITDLPEEAEAPAPQRATPPPKKKKSKLLLILVLLFVFVGLPVLGCGGLFLVFGSSLLILVGKEQSNSEPHQSQNSAVRPSADTPLITDKPPDKPDDKSQPVQPPDDKTTKPDDKSAKPDDKTTKPDDKTQPVKPVALKGEEEINHAAEGLTLVPVDLEIGGVPFTIQAPEGTKVAQAFGPEHLYLERGDDFKMLVQVGRMNTTAARDYWRGDQSPEPLKDVLVEGKDVLVSRHQAQFGSKDPAFHFIVNARLGHLDFRVQNDWYNKDQRPFTQKECLLMAHCARTAALKNTYQEPKTGADLEKLVSSSQKHDQGMITSAGLPTAFSDATLPYLVKAAPDLEYLYLGNTQVSGDGLAALAGLKHLHNLTLPSRSPDNPLDGSGLVHLKGLTQLEELQLNYTGVKAEQLAPLASLTALKRLGLAGNNLTGNGLDWLKALTKLTFLDLEGQPFTDAGVAHLKGLPSLQELQLNNTAVTGATFDALQTSTDLQTLMLGGSPVTDAGLKKLAGLTKLKALYLTGTKVTDAGLGALKGMTGLEELDLAQTEVTGTGFAELGKLTALNTLRLSDSKFGDAGLPHLGKLTGLTELELEQTPVTGKGFAALKDLKELRAVNLGQSACNDAGLAEVGACKSLESLVLNHTKITDAGWKHLKGLEKLQTLDCNETAVTGAGAEALQALKKLTNLNLYNTKFNDAGLAQLKGLTWLTGLDLSGTAVGDAGLANLKGMTNLQSVSLNKTAVTDAGLDHLKELKMLQYVSVYETKVTKDGVEKLKKALPKVEVYRTEQ